MLTKYLIEKYPNIWFWFFLIGMPISIVIGITINNNWLKSKTIDTKYCYYWKNDSVNEYVISSNQAKHPKTDYQILAHYYCPEFSFPKELSSELALHMNGILKVDV